MTTMVYQRYPRFGASYAPNGSGFFRKLPTVQARRLCAVRLVLL